jgi:hypothetical protein
MLVDREEKRSKACIQYGAEDVQNCKLAINTLWSRLINYPI